MEPQSPTSQDLQDNIHSDEDLFITTHKPGVLDLRPYLTPDGDSLQRQHRIQHFEPNPILTPPPWKPVLNEECFVGTSLSAEFLKCPKEVKSMQRHALESRYYMQMEFLLDNSITTPTKTIRLGSKKILNTITTTTTYDYDRSSLILYKTNTISASCKCLKMLQYLKLSNAFKKIYTILVQFEINLQLGQTTNTTSQYCLANTAPMLDNLWQRFIFNTCTYNPIYLYYSDRIKANIRTERLTLPNQFRRHHNRLSNIVVTLIALNSSCLPSHSIILWKNAVMALIQLVKLVNDEYHQRQARVLDLNALSCKLIKENKLRKKLESKATDSWLAGGTMGTRNAVLVFRSSALANTSETNIITKPGHKLHITYRVVQAETKLLAKILECHGIVEASIDSNDFNLLWTGSHPKPGILRALAPHQRVNHFPRSYELTRKDRLNKNIEKMQHAKGQKHFDFIPQTFLMPAEYKELCATHNRVKGPWIVKPAASSRGRGIFIVESPNQVPLEEPVVVAKYISRPLLVKGHKCDLRLYVAVTTFDPLLIYIYEEGMVRFATVKYDTTHKQLWNPCMHLCNYSINKYHSDYVKSDDPSAENVGHKWTLSALLRHLKSLGKDTAYLMTQVEDLVVKAILACSNSIITACKMFVPHPNNCFELYGFDILIDEHLKPWLLEVNLSPSLGCDSPLDVRLKSAMLADLLTLVGVPAVDPILRSNTPPNAAKAIKMKFNGCRRVHSADGLSNTLPKKSKSSLSTSNTPSGNSSSMLTNEELKMIKNARQQFERRGGFVRIFPAIDSWSKYSQYLEPTTGIPCAGSTACLPFSMMSQRNNNQILYTALYPNVPITPPIVRYEKQYIRQKRDSSLDSVRKPEITSVSTPRQDRYERKLRQGHKQCLPVTKKPLKENNSKELKRQVLDMMRDGKRMSQVEVRRAFSQYLSCILRRISNNGNEDGHVEIVLKFLQKASSYLKNPFHVKVPSQKLSDKDRAAIVAKQLNDFLYMYNRETELYAELDRPSQLPRNLFADFLEQAREDDLEEVLMQANVDIVPNKKDLSFLRCLPNLSTSSCFIQAMCDFHKKPVKITQLS